MKPCFILNRFAIEPLKGNRLILEKGVILGSKTNLHNTKLQDV